jgi:hypothetical protein
MPLRQLTRELFVKAMMISLGKWHLFLNLIILIGFCDACGSGCVGWDDDDGDGVELFGLFCRASASLEDVHLPGQSQSWYHEDVDFP